MATPFVMTALVWFVVRMYLNDLYISIPDRILVVAAMAQFIQNIPTEVSREWWGHIQYREYYRMTHLLANLGWVDLDMGSSPGWHPLL